MMKRLGHDETGLATVEAAIALPVLLFVLLGIIEGGLLIFTQHEMDRAAGEAARYCSLYSVKDANCTQANVETIVNQTLTTPLLIGKTISSPSKTTQAGITTVTISISGSFAPLTALFSDAALPLSASTSVIADW